MASPTKFDSSFGSCQDSNSIRDSAVPSTFSSSIIPRSSCRFSTERSTRQIYGRDWMPKTDVTVEDERFRPRRNRASQKRRYLSLLCPISSCHLSQGPAQNVSKPRTFIDVS
ncbi:Uncharacterized protein Rs2_02243 [Raphanus sativus]|nr:Uncharacterized protein Rs2_02243 [Raphanus sativus]